MGEFVFSLLKRACTNYFKIALKSDRPPLVFGLAGPASVGNRPETFTAVLLLHSSLCFVWRVWLSPLLAGFGSETA